MPEHLRAAIYARVSTDEQRKNYSVPAQLRDCRAFALRKGYTVAGDQFVDPETGYDRPPGGDSHEGAIAAYVDDFTSTEESRPMLDALRGFLESPGFDVLVVHHIDRLARDEFIRRKLELEFEELGARVEYVQGDYDESDIGDVRKGLDSVFAKWENVTRARRSKMGKNQKAERGLFVHGRPPYGYRIDKTAQGGLAVDEAQAAVVRQIFDLYTAEHLSIRAIAGLLTSWGIVNHSGKTAWAKSTVARILSNTTYVGTWFYGRTERKRKHPVERDRAQWIEVQTIPLVSRAVFDAAQQRLRRNQETARRSSRRFYMLGGMVFCAECGRPYVSQTQLAGRNRRIQEAQSYRHRANDGHCANHQISARRLEELVWDGFTQTILDPDNLRVMYEGAATQHDEKRAKLEAKLAGLEKKRETLERQNDALTLSYVDPEIDLSKAEYVRQRKTIIRRLDDIEAQIATAREEVERLPAGPVELESFEEYVDLIRRLLAAKDYLTPQDKRQVLQLLFGQVVIERGGQASRRVALEGWFGSRSAAVGLSSSTR